MTSVNSDNVLTEFCGQLADQVGLRLSTPNRVARWFFVGSGTDLEKLRFRIQVVLNLNKLALACSHGFSYQWQCSCLLTP